MLCGPSGVGKSTLVKHLLGRLAAFTSWQCRCRKHVRGMMWQKTVQSSTKVMKRWGASLVWWFPTPLENHEFPRPFLGSLICGFMTGAAGIREHKINT